MERTLYKSLIMWKNSPNRKPLILNGARQVGKTYLLTEFGRNEYHKVAFFSLDRHELARTVFEQGGGMDKIMRGLSALSGVDITPGDTLVILDEIQDCPAALTSLKFFCEDAPDIHIAVAGSLLGVSIHQNTSFPVGKVDTMQLYPMSFGEFLSAMGKQLLLKELERGDWQLLNTLSDEYCDLLRQYYFVGGMPSAVLDYVNGLGFNAVRKRQQQILNDYVRDFSKHAPAAQVPRIRMVWSSIPSQLAKENKKFIYNALRKGARANDFEIAIQWLIDAGLIYMVNRVRAVRMPLKFYEEYDVFKLFILDVGLMGAMVNTPASSVIVGDNIFAEYKGAFTELFVCQQLVSESIPTFYFSANDTTVELDFVIQLGDNVLPVEVKAERNIHSKSMRTFINSNPSLRGTRLSMKNYIDQQWLECIPLWGFAEEFRRRLEIFQR